MTIQPLTQPFYFQCGTKIAFSIITTTQHRIMLWWCLFYFVKFFKTHMLNMIIVPEMIGSIIGVYNGKTFNQVKIKPEMIGHYLAEFSISYKTVKHGRPGIGATHPSWFIPLK
ncbi:hypothetical protein ACOSP7_004981 [Xanthoceras sorbifolium]